MIGQSRSHEGATDAMTTRNEDRTVQPASAFAPRRWGMGLKVLAGGWLFLLWIAWIDGQVPARCVLWIGALPGAFYWTVGSFLQRARTLLAPQGQDNATPEFGCGAAEDQREEVNRWQ